MYRVSFILGDRVFIEMKCTKQSAIGCIFQCHSFFSVIHSLHLRRNTLEKNTIYSYTRTFIGQKNFPNLRLTDKTFFLANTLNKHAQWSDVLTWSALPAKRIMWCRYLARDVWRTTTRSMQPSARWALGDIPSGDFLFAQQFVAPMTLIKRPVILCQPEVSARNKKC
jgi:hypothetical protein